MASILEITIRYECDDCGDEFTVDYYSVSDIDEDPGHEECPAADDDADDDDADECDECGCDCGDCACDSEECRHCGCGEDEDEEADEE